MYGSNVQKVFDVFIRTPEPGGVGEERVVHFTV
jgi:hypothetical protein